MDTKKIVSNRTAYISDDLAERGQCQTSLWNADAARKLKEFFDSVPSALSAYDNRFIQYRVPLKLHTTV